MLYPSVDPNSVKRRLRFEYIKGRGEPAVKTLEGVMTLLQHFHRPSLSIHELSQEAASYIQKQYRLRWAMVGLRGADGLYRYEVMAGLRDEPWSRHKDNVYTRADFTPSADRFNFGDISSLTRIYLEEQNPLYNEDEKAVNRPALLRSKRDSDETCLEADFLDTLIIGGKDELLGWIDYSGTIANEFPDASVIRGVEAISAVIGAAIAVRGKR